MKKYRFFKGIGVIMLVAILAAPLNVLANEPEEEEIVDEIEETEPEEPPVESPEESPAEDKIETMVMETTPVSEQSEKREPVVSVIFPSLPEDGESPLDFLIDPEQLVYLTDAEAYGGGRVDSGATILFHNHDGDYDFSRYSDRFDVFNQSEVPVIVTVTAQITNLGEIDMVDNPYSWNGEECDMYMAVVDNEGHERPLIDNGTVAIEVEMAEVDQYSFGLVGYCNPNGRWQDIYVGPRVTLTWNVEPVFPEEIETEEEPPEIELYNEILETEPYEEPGEPDAESEYSEPEKEPDAESENIEPEKEQVQEETTTETKTTTEPESSSEAEENPVDEEPPPPDDSEEPGPPSDG